MFSVYQVIDHCFQTGHVMGALGRDSLEAAHVTCISSSVVLIGSEKQAAEMRKTGVQDVETGQGKGRQHFLARLESGNSFRRDR